VYGRFGPPGRPYEVTLEYREEEHAAVTPQSPWALLDNDQQWRVQPLIAEGSLRSLSASYAWDTRNDEADPSAGWLIRASIEQGLGGTLVQPPSTPTDDDQLPTPLAVEARERFTLAEVDIRKYARLSPFARVALRVLATGSADGTTLPPQRQRTLGGEGSLPGFPIFAFDCGAREHQVLRGDDEFFPFYGCDRAALAQLEYQASFPFGRRIGRSLGLGTNLGAVRWVAFIDAGRAWTEADARAGRGNEDFAADAGLGIRIGQIGAYWAFPLTDGAGGANFSNRIGRRF
ncbi:MAG: BamA/TamA family outer membrane protein, partial [Longimicrobiales bacterium]